MTDDISSLFKESQRRFEPERAAEAREFRTDQRNKWTELGSTIVSGLRKKSAPQSMTQAVDQLFGMLGGSFDYLVRLQNTSDDRIVVIGEIPLLPLSMPSDILSRFDAFRLAAAAVAEIIPALCKVPDLASAIFALTGLNVQPLPALTSAYLARKYASEMQFRDRFEETYKKIENTISETSAYIKDTNEELEDIKRNYRIQVDALQEITDKSRISINLQTQNHMEESKTKFNDEVKMIKENAQKTIDAFIEAQRQAKIIEKPVALWAQSAKQHRTRFFVGLFVLVLAVISISTIGLKNISVISANLGLIKSDTAQPFSPASTLILASIIAVIAACGFVLKIAGRFVTNSLTLSEDAEVRSALADTFLGLTAEDKEISSEAQAQARTVMLAALFRPLPGHQQEEIQAPTVISLAQDLLGKKSSAS